MSLQFYEPMRTLWLVIRKLINLKRDENGNIHIGEVDLPCTKEIYEKYAAMKKRDINYDELKTYLDVSVLEIVLLDKNYTFSYSIDYYIEKNGITYYIGLTFHTLRNSNKYYFSLSEYKERKEPLHSIFNFSSKKTGAKNEYMYGPRYEYSKGKHCGFLGQYEVVNEVDYSTCSYQTKLLDISEDIAVCINKYLFGPRRKRENLFKRYVDPEKDEENEKKLYIKQLKEFNEFDMGRDVWCQDTVIFESFRDRKNTTLDNGSTILFWSKCMTKLENLHGYTGYTYVVINTKFGGFRVPNKIKSRYKKLIKSGLKPVLPNDSDDSEEDSEENAGDSDEESSEDSEDSDEEDITSNLDYDRKNPYFVQAVLEAKPKERECKGCCLRVRIVDNNYTYRIKEYDGSESLEIKKKY